MKRVQVVAVGLVSVLAPIGAVAAKESLSGSASPTGTKAASHGAEKPRTTGAPADRPAPTDAVDESLISYRAPAGARGNEPARLSRDDGVKVFDLVASVTQWHILPGQPVAAYAFNRAVPGPLIRVREGDQVRINVTNALPEPTSVHWHGLELPNGMDGAGELTQNPIAPGETFGYEFAVTQPGTFFYHSHFQADRQQALGLYGGFVVDPADPAVDTAYAYDTEVVVLLQDWLVRDGGTFPAMPAGDVLPNFFTINGKAYPATEPLRLRVGERVRLRFVGSHTTSTHPIHIHGGPFRIVESDGNSVPEAARKDTLPIAPGERYDVIWEARRPGQWLLHCHIAHHSTNDHRETDGAGGMSMVIDVRP